MDTYIYDNFNDIPCGSDIKFAILNVLYRYFPIKQGIIRDIDYVRSIFTFYDNGFEMCLQMSKYDCEQCGSRVYVRLIPLLIHYLAVKTRMLTVIDGIQRKMQFMTYVTFDGCSYYEFDVSYKSFNRMLVEIVHQFTLPLNDIHKCECILNTLLVQSVISNIEIERLILEYELNYKDLILRLIAKLQRLIDERVNYDVSIIDAVNDISKLKDIKSNRAGYMELIKLSKPYMRVYRKLLNIEKCKKKTSIISWSMDDDLCIDRLFITC